MYDPEVVRGLFDLWEDPDGQIGDDPGALGTGGWTVPHVNEMPLEKWLPAAGQVLDAGCGRGIQVIQMTRRGLSVTALDISPGLLRHARRRAEKAGVAKLIRFVEADLTEPLPFDDESFDICIALTGVLSHTGDAHRRSAANLVRCCKQGGLVIVGVDSYLGKIRQYLVLGEIDKAEHVADTRYTSTVSELFEDYCFTADELRAIFADLGCACEQMAGAPSVMADGYPADLPEGDFSRVLELERRSLGAPGLVGVGEQIVGVFRKSVV